MRRVVLPLVILLAFAAVAEYAVGWRSLLYPWLLIDNPLHVVAAAASLGATYVIRALRLYRYFRFRSGLLRCVRLLLQHNLYVNVLPLRAGEFAFPVLMNRYFGMPMQRSLPALLWLRILDLHALLSVMVLLIGLLFSWWWAAASAALWVAFPLAVLLGAKPAAALLAGRRSMAAKLAHGVVSSMPSAAGELTESLFLTLLNWVVKLVIFAWIVQMFAAQSYLASLAGAIGGELTMVLPIQGLAGFGTYEAGIVAALRSLGVPLNDALTGAVNLHFVVLGVAFVGAALSLLIPVSPSKIEAAANG